MCMKMATNKAAIFALLIIFFQCLASANADVEEHHTTRPPKAAPLPAPVPAPLPLNCSSLCTSRCEVASLQKRCLKYCGLCCDECKCVPSGHQGNKDECPCYRDKKNSKLGPKCP